MTDSLITGQKRREVAIRPEVSAAPGPPASRVHEDGYVLTCWGYDGAIRWRLGERLELLERRSIANGRRIAATLTGIAECAGGGRGQGKRASVQRRLGGPSIAPSAAWRSTLAAGLPPLTAVDEGSVEPSPAALPGFLATLPRPLAYPVAIDRTGRVADGYEVLGEP
jgi:hypothetical protein